VKSAGFEIEIRDRHAEDAQVGEHHFGFRVARRQAEIEPWPQPEEEPAPAQAPGAVSFSLMEMPGPSILIWAKTAAAPPPT